MRHSSANPLSYLWSWLGGRRNAASFAGLRVYLMFIGQPRSGTTLLGSLLNAHRHVLVAQELNVLKYLRRGYRRAQILWLLGENERRFSSQGRSWTGYDYRVATRWQGAVEDLHVIGDKKASKSSEELARRPELLDRLAAELSLPVKVIHVLRNPFNVIATIHRRSRVSLERAAELFFARTETNWRLMQQRSDQIHTLRLEDFIDAPQAGLAGLCAFIGVEPEPEYLQRCSAVVFRSPSQSAHGAPWTPATLDSITARAQAYPFLAGYRCPV
ncbi:MAG: hypothetical protein GTN86_06475 [Xanthomonadales bacterium]|uniref:sulfotransferase n=1 Tax=Hydrogenophaga sp. TaxID=1904254 RepID=UPI0016ABA71E|nr:sulfotransferase [Hydrogenophaga sp.]NIM70218.1 hypothetical protein [Xanthomonadales bacterium]NIN59599.1 hypothetical protein [Xanthomonadales bacterium]NIN75003.1 hypothetical protein [Xanthomonadales bacterium]NIO13382.1 hypothetical protein [Xanthomonadales bacterium]NIP11992.1 hypothetical protein [Xanthomonadales bacterium]